MELGLPSPRNIEYSHPGGWASRPEWANAKPCKTPIWGGGLFVYPSGVRLVRADWESLPLQAEEDVNKGNLGESYSMAQTLCQVVARKTTKAISAKIPWRMLPTRVPTTMANPTLPD